MKRMLSVLFIMTLLFAHGVYSVRMHSQYGLLNPELQRQEDLDPKIRSVTVSIMNNESAWIFM